MKFSTANDGIDHINVFSRGATTLGRYLSNFAAIGFESVVYGKFASVEGFWYWLGTNHKDKDQLRNATGYSAKFIGRAMREKAPAEELPEETFKTLIKKAIRAKIRQNPLLEEMLKESELPFAHYYVFNGAQKDADFSWIIEEIELIRKELKSQ